MDVDELKNKACREHTQPFEDAFIRLVLRRISIRITKYFVRTRVTPNQITVLGFLVGVLAAFCFALGEYTYLVVGAILIQLSFIFDLVDGEVARVESMQSLAGAWLDPVLDMIRTGLLFLGMAFGLWTQTNNVFVWPLSYLGFFGFAIEGFSSSKQSEIYGKIYISRVRKVSNSGLLQKFYLNLYGLGSIMLLLFISAIFNQLVVFLILFSVTSNLDWATKLVWYHHKNKKYKGNIEN